MKKIKLLVTIGIILISSLTLYANNSMTESERTLIDGVSVSDNGSDEPDMPVLKPGTNAYKEAFNTAYDAAAWSVSDRCPNTSDVNCTTVTVMLSMAGYIGVEVSMSFTRGL